MKLGGKWTGEKGGREVHHSTHTYKDGVTQSNARQLVGKHSQQSARKKAELPWTHNVLYNDKQNRRHTAMHTSTLCLNMYIYTCTKMSSEHTPKKAV